MQFLIFYSHIDIYIENILRIMSLYLKLFENHNQYTAYTASTEFIKPNVSHCIQEVEVHYNPINYAEDYLTFKALEDGTFQFTKAVNYSIDDGATWTELAANTNTPTIESGNKVMWKAELTPGNHDSIGNFSSTGNFNVEGNAMSLLFGDNFIGQTDLTGKDFVFASLFGNCSKLINAKNLSLPATTLADYCYNGMFFNCTSLIVAPELPATILAFSCYSGMFENCTSLNYIKAMFITTPGTTYTLNWVNGVASSGTFVKNSAAEWDVSGKNGIPNGWTVETASA